MAEALGIDLINKDNFLDNIITIFGNHLRLLVAILKVGFFEAESAALRAALGDHSEGLDARVEFLGLQHVRSRQHVPEVILAMRGEKIRNTKDKTRRKGKAS